MDAKHRNEAGSRTINRRQALKMLAGGGMALAAGITLTEHAGATGSSGVLRATTALNLRSKASTSGHILRVIPKGAEVQDLGQSSNGYRKVSYKGTIGWAYGAYLKSVTPSKDPEYRVVGEAVTTSAVNLRAGAGSNFAVRRVLAKGTRVSVTDQKRNGFRYVIADGYLFGWVHADYLSEIDEQGPLAFKTTRQVNLRAEPSSGASVLKVVPKGAVVTDYDLVMANGYRGVDYKGTPGWIDDDDLILA